MHEKINTVDYLLKRGANPNIGGGSFGSPLNIAVFKMNL